MLSIAAGPVPKMFCEPETKGGHNVTLSLVAMLKGKRRKKKNCVAKLIACDSKGKKNCSRLRQAKTQFVIAKLDRFGIL